MVTLALFLDMASVPLNRWLLNRASRSSWSPAILSSIVIVPILFSIVSMAVLVLCIVTEAIDPDAEVNVSSPAIVVIGLLMFSALNAVLTFGILIFVVLLALNALLWNVLSRALQAMENRGPSRGQVYALAWALVCVSLAASPAKWLLKWSGVGE